MLVLLLIDKRLIGHLKYSYISFTEESVAEFILSSLCKITFNTQYGNSHYCWFNFV